MPTKKKTSPKKTSSTSSHVTNKPVFEDLGFSPSESAAMKVKADLYFAIRKIIKKEGYKSRQLEKLLDQPQPRISELVNGKIDKVSIEKLLDYLDRLGEQATIKVSMKRKAS